MQSLVQSVKEKGSVQGHGPWLMVFENSLDYTVLVGQYQGMWEFLTVGKGSEEILGFIGTQYTTGDRW